MSQNQQLKVGLVGLDTSHAVAFTRLLNDPTNEHHIPGAAVTTAWPGGTPDWPISIDRVPGFREELESKHGVRMVDQPEAVAESVDLVMITAVDGRAHRELVERVLPAGKPVFVDKPFAVSHADAKAMAEAADRAGVPLMSCSALRFAEKFREAVDTVGGTDQVRGVDVYGPLRFEAASPGLFWYGCHAVEMLIAAMGPDYTDVKVTLGEQAEVYTITWADGRVGTYRGNRANHAQFGGVVHGETTAEVFNVSHGSEPFYASLMRAVHTSLPQRRSAVPADQMLAVVSLIEACNRARERA